jgi:phosphoglucomutase
MQITTKPLAAFAGQKPGTSGLHKKVRTFQEPGYLESFVQAIFDSQPDLKGGRLVLGGDGRFFNREAIQIILKLAAANGAAEMLVGRGGLLSTQAESAVIRKHKAQGGIILSASHNPGGPDGDFGVKFNAANGGPAPEAITEAIYQATTKINGYRWIDLPDIALDELGETTLGNMRVHVIDPVADYAELLKTLFDFGAIRTLLQSGFRFRFDAMHAITGPYASAILVDELGARPNAVINAVPLPDFGGGHPDPDRKSVV